MLDARTVLLLWSAEALMLSMLLIVLWSSRNAARHSLFWSAGFAAHGVGVMLVALRGYIPDPVSIEIANALSLSSYALWAAGLAAFDNEANDHRGPIPALIWIGFMFIPPVREDMYMRQLVFQLASAIGLFLLAKQLLSRERRPESMARTVLGGFLIFQGSVFVAVSLAGTDTAPPVDGSVPVSVTVALSASLTFITSIILGARMLADKTHERLHVLSRTDPLTGAFNRRGMVEAFGYLSRNAGKKSGIAFVLYDLDYFKQINDRHGHQAGDDVLAHFCRIADRLPAERGVFIRMGGEEFATLMTVSRTEDAGVIAENIRRNLALSPAATVNGAIPATVSIGIAVMAAGHADLDTLISRADKALYSAKAAGRNRTAIRHAEKSIIIPCPERATDPEQMDRTADRQVAALSKMASIGRT